MPAYAWMFANSVATADRPRAKRSPGTLLGVTLLAIMSWSMLGLHTVWAWRFGQETAAFETVSRALEPKQRALSLIFDKDSLAGNGNDLYVHYPVWYQAEKQGIVDFNFAWFPPQIVRYRPDRVPAVAPTFEWATDSFDWKRHRGADYRYFFVRHDGPLPENLFREADCPPVLVITRERWTVFERRACP